MKKIVPTGILFLFLFGALNATAQTSSIRGIVYEAGTGITLPHATVQLFPHNIFTVTNLRGEFEFPRMEAGRVQVVIQMLGKETIDTVVVLGRAQDLNLAFHMRASSFHLETVVVTATESRAGASTSSTISRAALDHLQINNLADIMQLLPGGTVQNPTLATGSQHFSIRSNAGVASQSNAALAMNRFGTAIIMDGAPISTNAHLQTMGATRGGESVTGVPTTNDLEIVRSGADLREISTDNIEYIEVIRGIPSAEHGDLTAGAVIIRNRAGYEPLTIRLKSNPNIYEISASRGLNLGNNRGHLNISVNYAYGVARLIEHHVFYQRVNARLLYSNTFFGRLSTNTSFSYTLGRDTRRQNPDDFAFRRESGAENNTFRFNHNGRLRFDNTWALRSINYTLSGDIANQYSFNQVQTSTADAVFSMSRTHGSILTSHGRPVFDIYGNEITNIPDSERYTVVRQFFTPYTSRNEIHGQPINFFGRVSANFSRQFTPNFNNRLVVGADFRSNANRGQGHVFNPETPPFRWISLAMATVRPRDFRDIPSMNLLGLYAENNILWTIANRNLILSTGVRYDRIKHLSALVPRLNASFEILPHVLSVRGGFGIQAKAPSLSFLFPEQAFFDFGNYRNVFNTGIAEPWRYVMVSTFIFDVNNSDLEMATSRKAEVGFDLNLGQMRLSVTYYDERSLNGYRMGQDASTFPLIDQIEWEPVPGGDNPDVLRQSGVHRVFAFHSRPLNDASMHSRGVEFDLNTGRINSIRTAFVLTGAYQRLTFWNNGYTISIQEDGRLVGQNPHRRERIVGFWDPRTSVAESESLITTLRAIHNIPRLGFVVSLSAQINWIDRSWSRFGQDSMLLKYISHEDGILRNVTAEDHASAVAGAQPGAQPHKLSMFYRSPINNPINAIPLSFRPYFLMNFHLSREISDFLRISFFANNLFSQRPVRESTRPGQYSVRMNANVPLFFGVELRATIR